MALDPTIEASMRLLLSDDGTTQTFTSAQLEVAVTLFEGRWCMAASYLARRKGADLASSHKQSRSIGSTSVSTSDPASAWTNMATSIEAFCLAHVDTPELVSYGPAQAGETNDTHKALFDLWMHANPQANGEYDLDIAYYSEY